MRGVGFDAMVDGGASLRCRFGTQTVRVELRSVHGGDHGEFEVRCVAPPRRPLGSAGSDAR